MLSPARYVPRTTISWVNTDLLECALITVPVGTGCCTLQLPSHPLLCSHTEQYLRSTIAAIVFVRLERRT